MPAYYDLADVLLSPRLEGTNTPTKDLHLSINRQSGGRNKPSNSYPVIDKRCGHFGRARKDGVCRRLFATIKRC